MREDFLNSCIVSPLFNLSSTKNKSFAFTLAEVLITLTIIGVVAAITIPIINNAAQDAQFKTAYKKSYSDISQAFAQAIFEQSLTPRTTQYDTVANASEWAAMKSAFKVTKDCIPAQLNECWVNSDRVCIGCAGGPGVPDSNSSSSFIDASGRSWAQYTNSENMYLVDTNGFKSPNKFGKDRWGFTLNDKTNARVTTGFPAKVGNFAGDITTTGNGWCSFPPCYYQSWLFD